MRNEDLPWIEKYRPKSLDEVIGQEHVTKRLKLFVKSIKKGDRNMPHLLFCGKAGIGKTSCAEALSRDAFGREWSNNWIELNASDERGIDVVRNKIKNFAQTARLPHTEMGDVFNIIFLDEADNLTNEAQAALRRPMEKYSGSCRFILSVNHPEKIISPIENRCQTFRFKPLSKNDLNQSLKKIEEGEYINLSDEARKELIKQSDGSMRKALNILYTLSLQPNEIILDDVLELRNSIDDNKVLETLKLSGKGQLKEAFSIVEELYWNGFSVSEILHKLFEIVKNSNIDRKTKIKLYTKMGETEYYIIAGSNPLFQLKCLYAWISENRK